MKPQTSFFTRLRLCRLRLCRNYLLILCIFILPYVLLSSCGESVTAVGEQQNGIQDLPVATQQGLLRLTINYKSGTVVDEYCWLVQSGLNELALLRRIASPELKVISIQQVSSLRLTKWTRETFWGRVVTGTVLTDSMCCTSVRYNGDKWFLESPVDTIQAVVLPNRIVNFFEKCPY